MSLFNNGPTKVAFGFGLGVMAAGLFKTVLPAFRGVGRPLLKAAVKGGVLLARDGREKYETFRETLADVSAEVKAEMAQASPEMPLQEPFTPEPKQNVEVM
jgi:hypothetical protein